MTPEAMFAELVRTFVSEGEIDEKKLNVLRIQADGLGISEEALTWLIRIEQGKQKGGRIDQASTHSLQREITPPTDFPTLSFSSAITRGGSILTPDRLTISSTMLMYKKRNKYLINVDSISISLDRIAAVAVDTSLLGTTIRISSYGSGEIVLKKFSLSDAKAIKRHIEERRNALL
jgi:hypothetical protein